jgi:hypothetical protein
LFSASRRTSPLKGGDCTCQEIPYTPPPPLLK